MIVFPGKHSGKIEIPASKSDSQRAILAAGLSSGRSEIIGIGASADEQAMLSNIKNLGAEVDLNPQNVSILGINHFPQKLDLNLGESGLGARLMMAQCIIHSGQFSLDGAGSLLDRPFNFYREIFENKITSYSDTKGKLPISLTGGFNGGELLVSGKISSQYISGLLMALPLAKEDSKLRVNDLKSSPYVQMTLNTLKDFGIKIEYDNLESFHIAGNQKYQATKYQVEGDWSSASYWLVASALGQKVSVDGLSMRSSQADKGILDALLAANCKVKHEVNGIEIDGSNRRPLNFDLTDAPDLFPALAVYAALTEGENRLKGLHRLEHKESNRGLVLQSELDQLGVTITLDFAADEMVIVGSNNINGGEVSSHNDHRIAMSLAILGMFSSAPISVRNSEAVNKSYPTFWQEIERLKA